MGLFNNSNQLHKLQDEIVSLRREMAKIADELDAAEQLSNEDKRKAAYALNLCTVSVSQIVDYNDLNILEQEYEAILNNLNLENFPKDEALLDILKQILDTITFFKIQEEEKKFLEREYQQKMKNAIWSAIPSPYILFGGDWKTIVTSLAISVGTAYMNYRKEKSKNQLEHEKKMWELQRSAIEQFNALRRELFSTAWQLADKYQFPEEYRLTERQISQYNTILMDDNLLRKYERLESIQHNFQAYPQFWYYFGNTAASIAADKTYDKEICNYYRDQALKHFEEFNKKNNVPLLREDSIVSACCLEQVDLMMMEQSPDVTEIEKLLDTAQRNAGVAKDVLQICAMDYLKIKKTDKAVKLLRLLAREDYNPSVNGQLASQIYVSQAIEANYKDDKKTLDNMRRNYETIQKFMPVGYLFPWPSPMPKSDGEKDKLCDQFMQIQQYVLLQKIGLTLWELTKKYTIRLNRVLQTPLDSKEYPDSFFLDKPATIEKRKTVFKETVDEKLKFPVVEYIKILNDFVCAIKSINILKRVKEDTIIKHLKDHWNEHKNNFPGEIPVDDFFSQKIRFACVMEEYLKSVVNEASSEIRKLKSMEEIMVIEGTLRSLCLQEAIPEPELLMNATEKPSDTENSDYISLTQITDRDYADKLIEENKLSNNQKKVCSEFQKNFKDALYRPEKDSKICGFYLSGSTGYIDFFKGKQSKEGILAVLTDKTKKEDLCFTPRQLSIWNEKGEVRCVGYHKIEKEGEKSLKFEEQIIYGNQKEKGIKVSILYDELIERLKKNFSKRTEDTDMDKDEFFKSFIINSQNKVEEIAGGSEE